MAAGTTDPAWKKRLQRKPLPDKSGRVLKLLKQFELSQWRTPDEIAGTQFKQLSRLLAHAQSTIPHYAATTAHIVPADATALRAGRWLDIPVLKRATVNRLGNELLSKEIPPAHGSLDPIYTSGTTGLPVRVVRTRHALDYWSAFTTRDHIWHNRDIDGTLAAIRSSEKNFALYPKGTHHIAWGSKDGVFKTGPSLSLNVSTAIPDMAEWIVRQQPDYILTMPNIIKRLAPWCQENGVTFEGLKEISVIGEMCGDLLRQLSQEAWSVPLHDVYSSREVGYIALQCPINNHYHVQSEGLYLEILDEEDLPCTPGQSGRVVATTLRNFAMPLIRYEIGDHAIMGEPCNCGRGLPVIKSILGREQDVLVLPDGKQSWTLLGSPDVRDFMNMAPIIQYQFAHVADTKIEVRLIVKRPVLPAEEAEIIAWVQKKFAWPFDVVFAYPENLPLTKAGKFKDFVVET
ncbi:MAG: phenylacetate--CoA ligase family protein [Alphaproteobacteria bacterium]|mgnify:FL=1|nr:phenylacetate--CoA ligase family protein [Alphaproteobacteria bacterium]MBT4017331.1 phenylacetate--CoA ligase family protein [Alphaproteobacteria bacterium]MBT7746939.1 phenylacetate--CoA ligase family protein [Alphaproteobacteria bacterium]